MAKKAVKKTAKTTVTKEKHSVNKQGKNLSVDDLDAYRIRLIALRSRIRGDVSTMTDGALSHSRSDAAGDLSAMPQHMADIGSDNYEQEQTLSFIQSDHATLKLIEAALERIKSGTYGICEDCGKPIPKVRLNVLPYTPSCVQCVELGYQEQ